MPKAVYLIHIDPPFKHARNYVGFTKQSVEERFEEHLRGEGSKLLRAAVEAGHKLVLARVWKGKCRKFERYIKDLKCTPKLCPHCTPGAERKKVCMPEGHESRWSRMRAVTDSGSVPF